ncbi:MAG: hypothetical protein E6H52_03385 [Betaproteobacteria bacterium]|nr:MAG: hypothetical protein E6H52_03385 [Betaproteobacteria bacterium]
MRTVSRWLMLLGLLCGTVAAWADEERAYTDGAVLSVGYIRTKYGMFDEYMKYLAGPYKRLMEEQKKAGTIVDYGVYQAYPRNPNEPDIILTVVYKNWAALDGLRDRVDPMMKRVFGSMDAASKGAVDRDKVREALGSAFLQELKLK